MSRGARRPRRAAAVLALGLAAACAGGEAPAPRHWILISVDTLRADLLGCYGYERPTSPAIDALAARGVLFEHVYATSPWTLPSHGSLLTGLYPRGHRLRNPWTKLPPAVPTASERLAARGFETVSIVNSFYLHHRFGLDRGFARATLVKRPEATPHPSLVTERALGWLRDRSDGAPPFFLFLHYYDTHSDYASLPRYRRRFTRPYTGPADGTTEQLNAVRRGQLALGPRDAAHLLDLYAAEIRQLDDSLARLFAFLEESGLADETLVVLTSDHGEEFLEHGGVMHGRTHFEEVMRVPLLMAGPGLPRGVRVAEPVSLVDVAPTALALLRVAPAGAEGMDGLDLAPLWRGGAGGALRERPLFAESAVNNDWNDSLVSVRRGRWKLVQGLRSGARALFDLEEDPAELRDVGGERAGEAERLAAELARFLGSEAERPAAPVELTPEEEQELRALGYLD